MIVAASESHPFSGSAPRAPLVKVFRNHPWVGSQSGKYVVRAEDLQRARKLLCAQRPMKHTEFEKYTSKYPISYGEAMAGVVFLRAQI